jgi:acyl dehydratase
VVDVYLKSKAGWKSTSRAFAELSPSDGTAFDGFGVSASVSGSTIVAGATGSNTVGTAYVFGP